MTSKISKFCEYLHFWIAYFCSTHQIVENHSHCSCDLRCPSLDDQDHSQHNMLYVFMERPSLSTPEQNCLMFDICVHIFSNLSVLNVEIELNCWYHRCTRLILFRPALIDLGYLLIITLLISVTFLLCIELVLVSVSAWCIQAMNNAKMIHHWIVDLRQKFNDEQKWFATLDLVT